MAIYLFCPGCKSTSPIKSKKCSKCGETFPREGRKYRVSVMVNGQRKTQTADNLTLARDAESLLRGDLVRGIDTRQKTVTLEQVWTKYIKWAQEGGKKSWIDDLRYYNLHIKPRFGSRPLDKITPFDLEKMKIEMGKSLNRRGVPFAPATIKHQLVLVRRLFNVARQWGMWTGENPISKVRLPKLDNMKTEFMSDEELTRFLKVLDEWPCFESAQFVRFALYTGFRRGELFRLKWSDIDFQRGYATLRTPKGVITKTLPISDAAIDVLRSLEVQGEHVFPGKNGQRTNFKGPWQRIRKAAGLPSDFRLHGLRHHFASALVSSGVGLEVVGELLTHKDVSTTRRYAHLMPNVVRDAAKRSADIIRPKPQGSITAMES